jgi:hypothetical protein
VTVRTEPPQISQHDEKHHEKRFGMQLYDAFATITDAGWRYPLCWPHFENLLHFLHATGLNCGRHTISSCICGDRWPSRPQNAIGYARSEREINKGEVSLVALRNEAWCT